MIDRTTKALFLAIALGLWGGLWGGLWARPTPVSAQSVTCDAATKMANSLMDIARGTCFNKKICP